MIPRSPLFSMLLLNWCIQVPLPDTRVELTWGVPAPFFPLYKDHTLGARVELTRGSHHLAQLGGHLGQLGGHLVSLFVGLHFLTRLFVSVGWFVSWATLLN